jgi:hypothetical protein
MLPGNLPFPHFQESLSMQKLFRPYLSLSELSLLCSLLSKNQSEEYATPLYGKLFKLKLEAEMGLRKEAHTLKPSLLQRVSDDLAPIPETLKPSSSLWALYNSNPSSLSPAQIRAAKTWGWQEGLMSVVEASLFEKEMGL